MPPPTPYTVDLAGRDPVPAMRDTVARIRALVSAWRPDQFERTYAPGKWTARQILTHLAQTEIALGGRARMALGAGPGFVAQPFDQDKWIGFDTASTGRDAAEAFAVLATFNAAFYGALSRQQLDAPFSHPDYGNLTVEWILHQQAGHQRHHLAQLETLAPEV